MVIQQAYRALAHLTDYLLWARNQQQKGLLVDTHRLEEAQFISARLCQLIIQLDQ